MPDHKNHMPVAEHYEHQPPAVLEAIWVPRPHWGVDYNDPDCGELTILLAGAPNHGEKKGDNALSGEISERSNDAGLKMATIDLVHLDKDYRGLGSGSRMYRAFIRLAMERGATHLGASSPSADAVRSGKRVFGVDYRTKFYDKIPSAQDEVISMKYEISNEEGWRRIDASERRDNYTRSLWEKYDPEMKGRLTLTDEEKALLRDYNQAVSSFYVVTDLRELDTSDWEPDIVVSLA